MLRTSVTPIFGASMLHRLVWAGVSPEEGTQDIFKSLKEGGVTTLDVTHDFPGAEEFLGKTKAAKHFTINSKTPGGIVPGMSTSTGIMEQVKELDGYIGKENVDVYMIHAPDKSLDLVDTCKGMNDAHQAGYFRRFGLSNFKAEEVEEVYAICKERGWVLPTVYEGNYSAVARRPETELLPTLRKLGIAFYAYSPMAGGLLTKTVKQLTEGGEGAGRFAGGARASSQMYNGLYNKPAYHKAIEMWNEAAAAAGCSNAEMAYRWVGFNSALSNEYGDALEFGCSKAESIPEVLGWLKKGPLGQEAVEKIDEIWKVVEQDAPEDNFNSFWKDHGNGKELMSKGF